MPQKPRSPARGRRRPTPGARATSTSGGGAGRPSPGPTGGLTRRPGSPCPSPCAWRSRPRHRPPGSPRPPRGAGASTASDEAVLASTTASAARPDRRCPALATFSPVARVCRLAAASARLAASCACVDAGVELLGVRAQRRDRLADRRLLAQLVPGLLAAAGELCTAARPARGSVSSTWRNSSPENRVRGPSSWVPAAPPPRCCTVSRGGAAGRGRASAKAQGAAASAACPAPRAARPRGAPDAGGRPVRGLR